MRSLATAGDAGAQYNLGGMYLNGRGVPQDYDEALRWFRRAADQGFAGAQSDLGFMYATGRGVPQDDGEAARLYRLAADQGLAGAQYNLGGMYLNGRGVPQGDGEALGWYRLAADQGFENARELHDTLAEAMSTVSNISFEEIDDQFRAGGPLTEFQEDERWKQYQGKCVEWRGELAYLTEGFLGGLSIGFKHRRDTLTYDVSGLCSTI